MEANRARGVVNLDGCWGRSGVNNYWFVALGAVGGRAQGVGQLTANMNDFDTVRSTPRQEG